jgi:hypothetical protein
VVYFAFGARCFCRFIRLAGTPVLDPWHWHRKSLKSCPLIEINVAVRGWIQIVLLRTTMTGVGGLVEPSRALVVAAQ